MRRSHTIIVSISHPYDAAYGYLSAPSSFGDWAAIDPGTYRPLGNGQWAGLTNTGERRYKFAEPNGFGVLDHEISYADGSSVTYPMRLIANDDGCEIHFTYFARPGMDDTQFESMIDWITSDFMALKSLLEARTP